ncbi:MAG: hypothetical protein Q8903_10455, partial [Bacteroidota bacterium]|nr:hypothetical protein [Bacteroidota bacterium]
MKKIITILLLLIFVCNSAGYVTAYILMKEIVKGYTIDKLSSSLNKDFKDITILTFDSWRTNDYRMLDEKEITYKDKIYDIVKIEKDSGSISFYCIEDKKEEALDDLIGKKEDSNSKDNSLESSFDIFVKNIGTDALV